MAAEAPDSVAARGDWDLIGRVWAYITPYVGTLVFAIAMVLIGVGAGLVQPILIKIAIDDYIAIGDVESITWLALVFIGVVALGFGARAVSMYLQMKLGVQTLAKLRADVFDHVMSQGQRFFDRRTTGSLMTRTTTDVDAVNEALARGAVMLLTDAVTMLGIFVSMLVLDWQLTLVAFSIAPIIIVVVNIFRKQLRKLSLYIRKTLSELNGFFAERINGMSVVQLYGAEERTREVFRDRSYRFMDAYRKSNWWDAGLYAIMDGMSALSIGLMLWFGASQFMEPGSAVTLGLLVAFTDYLRRIYVPIREFSGRLATLQRAVAALERIYSLLDTEDRVAEGHVRLPELRGEVRFDDVGFAYAPDRPQVLHHVSFEMKAGEVIALVGSTGSGKTTIGKVLTRMYDGYTGSVTVDAHELRDVHIKDLRQAVTVVQQDVYLFQASIRENLTLWSEDVDEARLQRAIDLARARPFIDALPRGLEHEVRERGGNLSAGQRQLLAIARAMVRDAPIVILDEATASVDSVTEKLIDEAVAELFAHKTVLVIAHRLSTIMKADRIVVLHKGRVVEQGTHDELMAANGRYRLLVETGLAH